MARSKIWEITTILVMIITGILFILMLGLGRIISVFLVLFFGGSFFIFSLYKLVYWQKKDEFQTVEVETFVYRSTIWLIVGILGIIFTVAIQPIIMLNYDFMCITNYNNKDFCRNKQNMADNNDIWNYYYFYFSNNCVN